jgi:hypothetical protein
LYAPNRSCALHTTFSIKSSFSDSINLGTIKESFKNLRNSALLPEKLIADGLLPPTLLCLLDPSLLKQVSNHNHHRASTLLNHKIKPETATDLCGNGVLNGLPISVFRLSGCRVHHQSGTLTVVATRLCPAQH